MTLRRPICLLVAIAAIAFAIYMLALPSRHAHARDDGSHANDPLHTWFDQLASGFGLCCSFADGVSVEDVDWDTQRDASADPNAEVGVHYRVRLQGQWIDVPPEAVVTEPNKFGPAVVWPYQDENDVTKIRCFMPGAGA
jgi:hypothetical protein